VGETAKKLFCSCDLITQAPKADATAILAKSRLYGDTNSQTVPQRNQVPNAGATAFSVFPTFMVA